jgi:serine/threonine protein phosphatase PrpC
MRASASARKAALSSSKIDVLDSPDGTATFIAGGRQTDGALPVRTNHFDAAVYSSRGRGYARYNEDAAGLFCDRRGWIHAFVLDQAGGLGGRIRGQASQIAANHIYDACQKVSKAPDGVKIDPVEQLRIAFDRAHKVLVDRQEGEVTTAVAAIARPESMILMNSGDSGAIHFSGRGVLKGRTRQQELGGPNLGALEHAIGLVPEGAEPTAYDWLLDDGDWVILATDGLFDSGLEDEDLARLLLEATTAEDAVNRICTTVLRRMGTFRAKPDNLTVLAMRAQPEG